MARAEPTRVLVHADESCLRNGMEPPNPGGNGALIEAPAGDSVARWDFYECSPDTTNNRMALAGAIAVLEWIRRQWRRARVLYVSDSAYVRSEEHTSELQSRLHLVCRLLLEKKKKKL